MGARLVAAGSGAGALLLAFWPAAARAQVSDGLLLDPVVPADFSRGRNISVTERPRPAFNPLGMRFGSFLFLPRMETGAGGTSNAYLDDEDPTAAAFVSLESGAQLRSTWSRHQLNLTAAGAVRDYLGQSRRNERTWAASASGRLDVSEALVLFARGDAQQSFENRLSGEVASELVALSKTRRDAVAVRGVYTAGRARATLSADHSELRFLDIPLAGGGVRDQSDRNRSVTRLAGQVELARTPSTGLFVQVAYARTTFGQLSRQTGLSRDSNAVQLTGGVTFDLAGRARGQIGAGYIQKRYGDAALATLSGLSVQGQLELFPTDLTTVTFGAARTIEDSSQGNREPFFDNRVSARIDHELLRNLILNARAELTRQSYVNTTRRGEGYRLTLGGRYEATRRYALTANMGYTRRGSNTASANRFGELRAEAGMSLQI